MDQIKIGSQNLAFPSILVVLLECFSSLLFTIFYTIFIIPEKWTRSFKIKIIMYPFIIVFMLMMTFLTVMLGLFISKLGDVHKASKFIIDKLATHDLGMLCPITFLTVIGVALFIAYEYLLI